MMSKLTVLVDLNVVLDVIQARRPFYEESAQVLDSIARQEVTGLLAAHTLTTLFYVLTRLQNRETAAVAVGSLLNTFTVASVDDTVIRQALAWGWVDFEDAVQMASALHAGADYLITRNPRDFKDGIVPIVLPGALPALLL
jgi:predicted nucleic acid-binding protein